jgi:phosphatidylglycerophosphate synthase
MNIGLYLFKMPFRKVIEFLLPPCKNISPNTISWSILPVGIAMSVLYYFIFNSGPNYLLLVGILLGFIRMIVATLDGLVAVSYNKSTVTGDIINRITPELCDLILYPVIIYFYFDYKILALLSLMLAWATPFFGYVGAACKCPVQSVGPVGQTDRLAALMLFSLLEYFSRTFLWNIDFFKYFLYWLVIGGTLTIFFRAYRHLNEAKKLDGK